MLDLAASLLKKGNKLVAALGTQFKSSSDQIGKVAAAVLVSEHLIGFIIIYSEVVSKNKSPFNSLL
jgi:hypothetical protein